MKPSQKSRPQFKSTEHFEPRNPKEVNLIHALLSFEDEAGLAGFLRDLMTPKEIAEFANRLEMAKLIHQGYPYQDIAKALNTSVTTVTRVAYWLYQGCGGYQKVVQAMKC